MIAKFAALTALVAGAAAQQACSLTTETHPRLSWAKCTSGGQCTNTAGSVTIDANWRWLHKTSGSDNCYTGNTWDTSICNTASSCATSCCVDGADYASTYGATTSGDALTLKFVTKGQYSTNVGSRLYLMESDTKYQSKFSCLVVVSNPFLMLTFVCSVQPARQRVHLRRRCFQHWLRLERCPLLRLHGR